MSRLSVGAPRIGREISDARTLGIGPLGRRVTPVAHSTTRPSPRVTSMMYPFGMVVVLRVSFGGTWRHLPSFVIFTGISRDACR